MLRYLILFLAGTLLPGCVDRRVEPEPERVLFENSKFEVSGLRPIDDGCVAFGSWRDDQNIAPAVVWLDSRGGVDLQKADGGIWLGDETESAEDVFVGITSLVQFEEGFVAVETTFDASEVAADTRNSIWEFEAEGRLETSFARDGRLDVDEQGGVIGLSEVDGGFLAPRASQTEDGLRQVHVDRFDASGDFEAGVGTVDVVDDIPDGSCREVCERGFSGFLDMTYRYEGGVYVVGTQIVSFFSDEPVLARLNSDGTWDTSFGTEGFLHLSESQFEGWRAHAAARREDELAVLLFPPRGENYRVTIVDLSSGVVSSRFDVSSELEDVHLDHIAAGENGWWLGGFDFLADNRPSFVFGVDSTGDPLTDVGEGGLVMLNRRISIDALASAPDDRLFVAYQKFGLTRLTSFDPRAPGDLAAIEVVQDAQNSR